MGSEAGLGSDRVGGGVVSLESSDCEGQTLAETV